MSCLLFRYHLIKKNGLQAQLAGKAHQLDCPKIVLDHVCVLHIYVQKVIPMVMHYLNRFKTGF